MKDITLYGHLVGDTVMDGDYVLPQIGGMANVWRALSEIDASLKIALSPTAYGQATIKVYRDTCTRESWAQLNELTFEPCIHESKISHVMYINELPNTRFMYYLDGIITADTCKGEKFLNKYLLGKIDYLFVADEDGQDLNTLLAYIKGTVILHSPTGSKIYPQDRAPWCFDLPENLIVKNANVLGAGDTFAACFLYGLHKGMETEGCIAYAHYQTSELIRKYNEKI